MVDTGKTIKKEATRHNKKTMRKKSGAIAVISKGKDNKQREENSMNREVLRAACAMYNMYRKEGTGGVNLVLEGGLL